MTLLEVLEAVSRGEDGEQYRKRVSRIRRLATERDVLEDAIAVLGNDPRAIEKKERPKDVKPGESQYEYYTDCRRKRRCQYDYRITDGHLFSCVRNTLEECEQARKEWEVKRKEQSK